MKLRSICLLTTISIGACGGVDSASDEKVSTTNEATIWTTAWSGNLNGGASIADAAVISRASENYDLFTLEPGLQGGNLVYQHYELGSWQGQVSLGRPDLNGPLRSVTATRTLTSSGQRIDVFAVSSDNHIYHKFSPNNSGTAAIDWTNQTWHQVSNNPFVSVGSPVAATSWGVGRIDLFWWTPEGNLGHAWADNLAWTDTETGNTPSKTYLQPVGGAGTGTDLSAVSWGSNRLDIFYLNGSGHIGHHWYDGAGNGWGSPNRENFAVRSNEGTSPSIGGLDSLSVASAGVGNLEVFVTGEPTGLPHDVFRTQYSGGWSLTEPGHILSFSTVEHSESAAPDSVFTALRSNSGVRIDLYGSNFWQALRVN